MIIHPTPSPNDGGKRLGYLHVYTGEGKGKTSAALGLLLRAAGQGHRVLMIQFLKGKKDFGEIRMLPKLGRQVTIMQFGRADIQGPDDFQAIDAYLAVQGLAYAREVVRRRRPDVLILDELATAIHHQLLRIEDVVDFLDNRPQRIEVIVTGERAHPVLLNMADLVTVMYPTKHYFDRPNFSPRLGIEY